MDGVFGIMLRHEKRAFHLALVSRRSTTKSRLARQGRVLDLAVYDLWNG